MGAAYFYHLMRSPLEDALPPLLRRSLAAGWRVELRGTTIERMAWLDERLWLGADNDFLPHGLAGGPHDALQPILLGTSRKSTLGKVLDLPADQRVEATLATTALAIRAGVDVVRVHDVLPNARAARVADAVIRGWRPDGWPDGAQGTHGTPAT